MNNSPVGRAEPVIILIVYEVSMFASLGLWDWSHIPLMVTFGLGVPLGYLLIRVPQRWR